MMCSNFSKLQDPLEDLHKTSDKSHLFLLLSIDGNNEETIHTEDHKKKNSTKSLPK